MVDRPPANATDTLIAHAKGDPAATEQLFVLLYSELRRVASGLMSQERPDHTLQPTALLNEAYMRLIDIKRVTWKNKAHFCNMAAKVMRRILCEYAEYHGAGKRGAGMRKVTLDSDIALTAGRPTEIVALDQALERLARISERASKISELRIFGGLRNKEIAHVLAVSERTVLDEWHFARAWLARELSAGGSAG